MSAEGSRRIAERGQDPGSAGVIRPSGLHAVLAGETVHVKMHDSDHVYVAGPYGSVQHEMDELDDLLSVRTSATWRGGRIAVSVVSGDGCTFNTTDQRLAEREGLDGDFYNGWHGAAPLDELTDVDERATSIHPRRRHT